MIRLREAALAHLNLAYSVWRYPLSHERRTVVAFHSNRRIIVDELRSGGFEVRVYVGRNGRRRITFGVA